MNQENREHNEEEIKRLEIVLSKGRYMICRQCHDNTTVGDNIFCDACLEHQKNTPCSLCGKPVQSRMKKFCKTCKIEFTRKRLCLSGRIKQRAMYDRLEYLESLTTEQLIEFVDEKKAARTEGGKMKAVINGIEIEGTTKEFADFFGTATPETLEQEGQTVVDELPAPTQPYIVPKHTPWTDIENQKLMEMRTIQKMKFQDIGKILGRSLSSCRAQCANLKYRKSHQKKEPPISIDKTPETIEKAPKRSVWSPEERKQAVQLIRNGHSDKDIAEAMGKNTNTIKLMRYNMQFYDSLNAKDD